MPALTMNAIQTIDQRAVLNPIIRTWDVNRSLPFDSTYLAADSYGNKFLYPGLLVAFNSTLTMYVPYNENGSYGTYSTYLEGVVPSLKDFTYQDQIIAPVSRAAVKEEHCYVYGGSLGDIPAGAKQNMSSLSGVFIQWD